MTRIFKRVNATLEVGTNPEGRVRTIRKIVVVQVPMECGLEESGLIIEPHAIRASKLDELILVSPGRNMVLPEHCVRTSQNFGPLVRPCGNNFGFNQVRVANFDLGSCLILNCPHPESTKRICYACVDEKAVVVPF